MRKNKKAVSFIAMLIAVIMIVGILASLVLYATANAQSVSELERQKAQVEQELSGLKSQQSDIAAEREEIEAKIKTLENESAEYTAQKQALEEKVALTLEEISVIESQLNTYEALIEQKEAELQEAEEEQEYQLERYKARVRTLEEDGNMSYFSILFSASNFSELLSSISDMQEIMEYDQEVAQQLEEATKAVETAKTKLEETKAELETSKRELEDAKAQLETEVAEAETRIDQLQTNISQSEEEKEALEEEEARVEADISSKTQSVAELDESIKAAAEAARKAAAEAAAAAAAANNSSSSSSGTSGGSSSSGSSSSSPGTASSSGFIRPVSGGSVTSEWGNRMHPIYKYNKFHAGIDIGVPTGTSVYASADGQVVTATYSSSYGYYVLINHGGGIYTLYAHNSSLSVSVGDAVYQGQVIAKSGSTGNSTGPHCHFEVRVNGSSVNPRNYVNF